MTTFVVRRLVPLLGLGVVLGSIIRNQHVPLATADAWFHVRFGREFLADWSLRNPGHLGVYDSADWIPTQWLSQVGMAWTEDRFGVSGLMWITGVLLMLLAVVLYVACRGLAAPLPATIATALGLMAASPGFSARPQIFSYLFIVLTVSAWLATSRDSKPRYWLIALAWLWPMLHGMWPVGISISVVAVLGLLLDRQLSRRTLAKVVCIPVISVAVSVLSPLGPAILRSLVDVGSRSQYFAEWGPANFTAPAAAVLALMLVLVILVGIRTPPTRWVNAGLTVLALIWGLYSLRTTAVAALMLAPLLGAAIQHFVPSAGRMERGERMAISAMLAVACFAMWPVADQRSSEAVVPRWVDSSLDALPAGTKVLNDWATGSWFLFRHDRLDWVMHGYGDVFTDSELERNAALVHLEPGWADRVTELDADLALLDKDSPLGAALSDQLDWTLLKADEDFVLLAPPTQP